MRGAAATFTFTRPDERQRHIVLADALQGIAVRPDTIGKLVQLTGPSQTGPATPSPTSLSG
ncbi:MAG: hypothetical protein ABIS86_11330 [Streptosporangiaceae bacterium]